MKRILSGLILVFLCAMTIQAQDNLELKLNNGEGRRIGEYYKTMRKKMHMGLTGGFQYDFYKRTAGLHVSGFYNIAPVILQIGGIRYSKSEYGFDTYISFSLLPDYGKFSTIFIPYIGIGYQRAYKSNYLMWKTGFMFKLKKFLISGEYKQSVIASKENAMGILSAGIGFCFY